MRKEFGISARETFTGEKGGVTPEWEINVLVDEWARERERDG